MFTELMPLLRKRTLLLTLSLVDGDTIRATVIPQRTSEIEDAAVTTPLALTGTAEELDREFAQQLVEFTGAHLRLQTTLATAKAEIDAAAKAAREDTRKKSARPSSTTSTAVSPTVPAAPAPEPPPLFAQQASLEMNTEQESGDATP
jgi:PRTRC genetic system protein E